MRYYSSFHFINHTIMATACCILITFSMLQIINAFDADYYFSSPLRTKEINCVGLRNVFCQLKCGHLSPLCIKNECYCLSVTSPNAKNYSQIETRSPDHVIEIEDHAHPYEQAIDDSFRFRPTLRHHIAHFCPNIETAKQCIKKCMALGKPAFCGKDHVCYCGHKYEHMEDDAKSNSNAKDIYSQFKDLYKKYLGVDDEDVSA